MLDARARAKAAAGWGGWGWGRGVGPLLEVGEAAGDAGDGEGAAAALQAGQEGPLAARQLARLAHHQVVPARVGERLRRVHGARRVLRVEGLVAPARAGWVSARPRGQGGPLPSLFPPVNRIVPG
jgi:hypothetical protein